MITLLPSREPSSLANLTSFLLRKNYRNPNCTPLPVASTLPEMPPLFTGFPVTQALAVISDGFKRLYSSAIHAISFSPLPISGAGTFCEG
jgi:hypothetical protein